MEISLQVFGHKCKYCHNKLLSNVLHKYKHFDMMKASGDHQSYYTSFQGQHKYLYQITSQFNHQFFRMFVHNFTAIIQIVIEIFKS